MASNAVKIGFAYSRAIDLLRREPRLEALLRRAVAPWSRAVVPAVRAPEARELPVDENGDVRFFRTGTEIVRGYEPRNRRIEEARFLRSQITVCMLLYRHPCLPRPF